MERVRRLLMSKSFLVPVVVLLLYTLVGFFLLPFAVRWYVPRYTQDHFRCRTTIKKVRINPFVFSFEAVGFSLTGPDGRPIAGFARLFLDFQTTGLFGWAAEFREIKLEEPSLNVSIEPDGSLNLAALAPGSAETEPKAPASKPMRLVLQSVAVKGGKITVTDRRQSEPAVLVFQDLDLELKALSTLHEQSGTYSLSAGTQTCESIQWQGNIGLAPFYSSGKLSFNGIRAATLWGFARNDLNLDAPEGELNLSLDYRLDTSGTPLQLSLENLRAEFSNLSLKVLNTEAPFVELKKIELDSARMDLASGTVEVGRFLADGGRLHVLVDESGQTTLQQVVRKAPERPADQEASTGTEAQAPPSSGGARPWKAAFANIELKDIALDLEDLSRHSPIEAGASSISIRTSAAIETGPQARVSLRQFAVDLLGVQMGAKGAAKRSFEAKEVSLAGGDFDLDTKTLKVASVRLGGGRLAAVKNRDGRLDVEALLTPKHRAGEPERKGTEAVPAHHEAEAAPTSSEPAPWKVDVEVVEIKDLALGFEDHAPEEPLAAGVGSAEVRSGVSVQASRKTHVALTGVSADLKDVRIGGKNAELPIFETRQLVLEGGDLDLAAQTIRVTRLALNDGRFEFGREADGRMNFERFLASKPETPQAAPSPAPGTPWKFSLKDFELSNFRGAVLDKTVLPGKPLYSVQDLRARVSGVDGKSPIGFEAVFPTGARR